MNEILYILILPLAFIIGYFIRYAVKVVRDEKRLKKEKEALEKDVREQRFTWDNPYVGSKYN